MINFLARLLIVSAALSVAARPTSEAPAGLQQLQSEPQPQPYACDRLDKVPAEQRCSFVLESCEADSLIPYTQWYYCHVAPHGGLPSFCFTLLLAALLPLYFTLLGDTAEIYFSPIMTHVSQSIPKMRPRFAGVTFVAMGNGATDLSANITAIRNGNVLLSAGALTGAAMFVQCVVASEVMRASRGTVKCRGATLRDLAIYVASILMVLAAFAHGRITYWFIAGAVLLYLSYAVWVFVGDEWHERGRPEAVTLWRDFSSSVSGRFSSRWGREAENLLPWAQVDVGPGGAAGRGRAGELTAPLVDTAAELSEGGGITSRPASPADRRPHQQPHRHHLMSAKAYQNMVWADLSREEEPVLPRRAADEGAAGGPRRSSRRSHGSGRRGRGVAPLVSSLELGASGVGGEGAAYRAPPLPPPTSGASDAAAAGGSQLVTLSSLNGSALAAPIPVDAAPGGATSATAAAAVMVATPWAAGAVAAAADMTSGKAAAAAPAGRLAPGLSLAPWDSEGSWEEYDDSDEEEEGLLEAHSHRRDGGGGSVGGDGDAASVVSSGRAALSRGLWGKVRYELTVGTSGEWEEMPANSIRRCWRAVTFPLLLPVYAALRFTIPFVDPATYSRRWLVATCVGAPLLAAAYLAPGSILAALIALATGACLAAAVGYFTAGEDDALPDWDFGTSFAFGPAAFAVFGFFMGIIWIDTLAAEVVGVISLLASLLRMPASVMGLTLLAWGNSLGDFFGNPAMARRGQPTMALTACFAGPLFNMLASMALGFGSYFARCHVSHADVVLRPEVALGCVFLVVYNAAVAAAGLMNRGSLPERFYVFARAWYATYFVLACALGLWAGQSD